MIKNFKLIINDKDANEIFYNQFLSLVLTDKSGDQADQLKINLSAKNIPIPQENIKVILFLYDISKKSYIKKGIFNFESFNLTAPPENLQLNLTSVNFLNGLKSNKNKSWREQTIYQIIDSIARKNGLDFILTKEIGDILIAHIDQTNESDLNFLMRLAENYDAIFTIKNNHIIFKKTDDKKTKSGGVITPKTINISQIKNLSLSADFRYKKHDIVKAKYRDIENSRFIYMAAGSGVNSTNNQAQNIKILTPTYPDKITAQNAAKSHFNRLNLAKLKLNIFIPAALPDIISGQEIILDGFRAEISQNKWLVDTATHQINQSGFSTNLTLNQI